MEPDNLDELRHNFRDDPDQFRDDFFDFEGEADAERLATELVVFGNGEWEQALSDATALYDQDLSGGDFFSALRELLDDYDIDPQDYWDIVREAYSEST